MKYKRNNIRIVSKELTYYCFTKRHLFVIYFFILQVHAWVNYESLLQKCIVGSLGEADTEGAFIVPRTKSSSKLSAASGQNPAKKLIEQTRNISIATNAVWSSSDWFQQLTFICLIFYLKATVMQVC